MATTGVTCAVFGVPDRVVWLTDYLISQDLQAQYQAQQQAALAGTSMQANGGPPILTPEIKQMIADEVRSDLALENSEAQQSATADPGSSSIARLMQDGRAHTFVAGGAMDVVDASGAECGISNGDALVMSAAPPPNTTEAMLVVVASKGGQECRKDALVRVPLNDLQEMQNHMRETIDQGLAELQTKQGQGGLPPAPASAVVAPIESAYARQEPPAETGGAAEVAKQLKEADAAEQQEIASQVSSQGGPSQSQPGTPTLPPSLAIGESLEEVVAALGQPTSIADLGARKTYVYPDRKIRFAEGKVTAIETR